MSLKDPIHYLLNLGVLSVRGERMIWSTKVHVCYDLKEHLEDDIV
jgi:hypothetical protein